MEALKNAAKTHSPSQGGEIIPLVPLIPIAEMLINLRAGPCDVTKKQDLENLVSEISKKEKYINLLITNAGISGPKAMPESEKASELKDKLFTEEFSEWSDTFNTNVSSVYFTTVAFLPLLVSNLESPQLLN
jgi:NAD(P)-dependent dehydrogenase (short-subunit alcohol dehydrogenase family)